MFKVEAVGKVTGNPSLFEGNLIIKFLNNVLLDVPVCSGKFGKGALPEGLYKASLPTTMPDTKDALPFKKEGFPWLSVLVPQFKTDRTELCIHPDGNVYGTLGCLGIQKMDIAFFYLLNAICRIQKDVMVNVKYNK